MSKRTHWLENQQRIPLLVCGGVVFFFIKITAHLKEEASAIENTRNDYSSFENIWIDPSEFAHVIEIYDFPSMFKTDDLLHAFSDYR